MRKITVKRLSADKDEFDYYFDVKWLEVIGESRLISIYTKDKKYIIPVSNIDFMIEEEI